MQHSSHELKEQGNRYFSSHQYDQAVDCYTRAIQKDPDTPTYYTNRALCHLHTKHPNKAVDDCRKALELDFKSVKAHFFLGRALVQQGHYDEAIKSLIRAHELAVSHKLQFGDDITAILRQARHAAFKETEMKRIAQDIGMQTYVNRLIEEDMAKRLAELPQLSNQGSSSDVGDDVEQDESIAEQRDAVKTECEEYKRQLADLLSQMDERRRERDVPDYMCGRISFEILRDPVITPSGITYDRKAIMEHLQRVGHFDPVSRQPLNASQLIPNLALREAVENFLRDNEWAVDY